MRVLIVDDEPLAQTALANILSARSDVEHFDSANDASEALEKLAADSYDVLLLDINMLDLSGTQLVDQLRERKLPLPSIVFVTAHVEHAVAAFERHTVDYVLKPFSNESINEALHRASRRAKGERAAKLIEALPQLQKLSSPGHPMIAIKVKGRIGLLSAARVNLDGGGKAEAVRIHSDPSICAREYLVCGRDQILLDGKVWPPR
ncbi:MAG: response regulator [Candidatus Sulfotelmatobacter sp.]